MSWKSLGDSNDIFFIDGNPVGTGCQVLDQLPGVFEEFPEHFMLDDKDIEKQLSGDRYKADREQHAAYLINQSRIGKCNTSAAAGGLMQVRQNDGAKHVALCDNYLYYHINGGRDGGSALIDGMQFVRDHGMAPRILDVDGKPYRIGDLVVRANELPANVRAVADQEAARFKSWEPFRVPTEFDRFKRTIASAVARRFPIVHAWHVVQSSMRLDGRGYIVTGRGRGNHATLIHSGKWVGGSDLVHPDVKNSWGPTRDAIYGPTGTGWGDKGYGLMTMAQAFACRAYHDFYVLVGAVADPKDSLLKRAA